MPIDLSAVTDALARGFSEIPPIVLALALLAGPTAALIVYRLVRVAQRTQAVTETEAAPLWVCQDCRSVNEFRMSRCYRCGVRREADSEVEVIVDAPATRPSIFEAPEGSPFAALGGMLDGHDRGAGVPVMADPSEATDGVAVGPGRPVEAEAEAEPMPAEEPASGRERGR